MTFRTIITLLIRTKLKEKSISNYLSVYQLNSDNVVRVEDRGGTLLLLMWA
jgi:hypothetical protein